VDAVCSAAPLVLIVATLATVVALTYSLKNLTIKTDTGDMLSASLPFRRSWRAVKKAFPQYRKTVLVVIDGATPDLAQEANKALVARLKRETDIFETVYLPGSDSFFEKNALLYLSTEKLEDLTDNLSRVQPFLARLIRDQTLRGFLSLLTSASEAVRNGKDLDLAPMFDRVSAAIQANVNQIHYQLSWQELIFADKSSLEEHRRRIIAVEPYLDDSELLPAARAMRKLRQLAQELQLNPDHGVRVRLTGEAALEYEELISVSRGAGIAGLLALIMVLVVLLICFGSFRLVFATLVTLLMGLIWTAGFATATLGHLNLISVAFAVLYIGLSVDYAVHFCLRYRELMQLGNTQTSALVGAGQDVGTSLCLCAISTAIGFYAFLPTAFIGVSELGLIAGTGVFISLFSNLTVLPALLSLLPISPTVSSSNRKPLHRSTSLLGLPFYHAKIVIIGALFLGLAGLILLPRVRFDYNPLNLRDPAAESVATYRELLEQGKTSPWNITVVAPNEQLATEYKARINRVDQVQSSLTLHNLIPSHQEEKLAVIEEMRLILGPHIFKAPVQSRPDEEQSIASLHALKAELNRLLAAKPGSPLVESTQRLYQDIERFESGLGIVDQPAEMLADLEISLLGSLPASLRGLQDSLAASPISEADLPEDLVTRWVSPDGRYRIKVLPRENVNDNESLSRFVAAVRSVAPDATGTAVISVESGRAIARAFRQALFSAMIAIAILLLLILCPKSDTLLVLSPLLLAGVLTGGAMVILNIPFNLANVIALPVLLGIGVDSGIHIVHRHRNVPPATGNVLHTSTARGVLFSGLTTLCSFGNLAFSSHRGLATMGLLLTVGMGFTLLCTLIVLPALLSPEASRRH
jgi:hopanoid biosynthesis associated RND transporter like protein HpnN